MLDNTQMKLEDVNDEYKAFVDKFKPKKTTDDCYTPPEVYEAVRAWVFEEYDLAPDTPVVRPFWPEGDYEREEYPEGCVVIDNPPFSIMSRIVRSYQDMGVRFFLFAPYLTVINPAKEAGVCALICDADITYENGAVISTCFITNMDPVYAVRTAISLRRRVLAADRAARPSKELPVYAYPDYVLTATMVGYMSTHGEDYAVRRSDVRFIRALDSQRAAGKSIFGGGYLLSKKAAAEKAAAEKAAAEKAAAEKAAAEKANAIIWELSDRERALIESLGEEIKDAESDA